MSILSLLGLGNGSRPTSEFARIEPRIEATPPPAQVAPSVDPGMAAVTVEALLASHEDLLSRIKLRYKALIV